MWQYVSKLSPVSLILFFHVQRDQCFMYRAEISNKQNNYSNDQQELFNGSILYGTGTYCIHDSLFPGQSRINWLEQYKLYKDIIFSSWLAELPCCRSWSLGHALKFSHALLLGCFSSCLALQTIST